MIRYLESNKEEFRIGYEKDGIVEEIILPKSTLKQLCREVNSDEIRKISFNSCKTCNG